MTNHLFPLYRHRAAAAGAACLLLGVALLAGCTAPADPQPEDPAPARIVVEAARKADIGQEVSLPGTLTAEREVQLSPRTDGLVHRVLVDAGDRVRAGQVLLELDDTMARQPLSGARAGLAQATAAREEAQRLLSLARRLGIDRYVSASQVETRESELAIAQAAERSARASVEEQREVVERHRLPAPFAGVVSQRLSEAGAWVQRGTPALTLVATDRVRLDVQAPQERFAQFAGDVGVQVHAEALGGTAMQARVGARVPVTDPGARTFLLRLLVDDPAGRLLPGMSARATIRLPPPTAAVVIGRDALLRQVDGGYSVFVVGDADTDTDKDTAASVHRRSVQVAYQQGDRAVIGGGLGEGERVVVRGNDALREGQRVLIERAAP
ncbi:efflux RND transporter periplasmic adaptor subunit [Luteimonas sp. XNQY3]|nr:efflux RND transporter periplasmic adaptor subunit [Luteimonas sp. XNQY3]MCD9004757.1 efflux RND transporter periplasmic adaptor subunit [Luteimonas sp. XNQY3]